MNAFHSAVGADADNILSGQGTLVHAGGGDPDVSRIVPDGKIAVYAVPGSDQLGENIGKCFAEGCDIVLLENHGVCIGAQDMFTAFQRFETLNYAAELDIIASKLGYAQPLTQEEQQFAITNFHTKMDDFIPRQHTSEELSARRDMITLIRRSYRQGLFTATHGTYSVRLADDSFLITPFGLDRAYLEEDDLVRVKGDMKELGKTPSRAVHMHALIYKHNPEIRAILQAHPLHAMAFAVTGAKFDPRTIPESYILLRDIQMLPYAELYGDQEKVAKMFGPAHPAMLVEDNCAIVTGSNLLQAFDRLEVLESTAHSIINSLTLGPVVHISDEEVADLKKAFNLVD